MKLLQVTQLALFFTLLVASAQSAESLPQAAVNLDGESNIVLNQDDNPIQGLKVWICENATTTDDPTAKSEWIETRRAGCSKLAMFVSRYEGRCEQKFVYRKTMRWDGRHSKTRVASCCSCVARTVIT